MAKMVYDPVMCMMVPESAETTKDSVYSDIHNKLTKYNANDVLYNLLEDARLTNSKSELKRIINEVKQIIKRFPYREDDSTKSWVITKKLREAEEKFKTMDERTIDRAIKMLDVESTSSYKSYLKSHIDEWFRSKNKSGRYIDVYFSGNDATIYYLVDGKRYSYTVYDYTGETPKEAFWYWENFAVKYR